MDAEQLPAALVALGCPAEKSREMAAQLEKRARQLMEQRGVTHEAAMRHLLQLMSQGWASPIRGQSDGLSEP